MPSGNVTHLDAVLLCKRSDHPIFKGSTEHRLINLEIETEGEMETKIEIETDGKRNLRAATSHYQLSNKTPAV